MTIRRRWMLLVLLLLVAVGLLVLGRWSGGRAAHAQTSATRLHAWTSSARAQSATGAIDPWTLASQVGAQADQAEAVAAAEKAWLLDPRNDAAWCQRGAPAVVASERAERASGDGAGLGPRGPAHQAWKESLDGQLSDRAQQLAARGDEASLAVRDFLLAGSDHAHAAEYRSSLLASSLRSADPFVHWLGAQKSCGDNKAVGPCARLLALWRQSEPTGLDLALWQIAKMPVDAGEEAAATILARTNVPGARANHTKRYLETLDGLVADSGQAGLRRAAKLLSSVSAQLGFEQPPVFPLIERCRYARTVELRKQCLAVSEQIFDADYRVFLQRLVAVAIARQQLGESDEIWRARGEEMEATRLWIRKEGLLGASHSMEELAAGRCESQDRLWALMKGQMKLDERGQMQQALARRDQSIADYLATSPRPARR